MASTVVDRDRGRDTPHWAALAHIQAGLVGLALRPVAIGQRAEWADRGTVDRGQAHDRLALPAVLAARADKLAHRRRAGRVDTAGIVALRLLARPLSTADMGRRAIGLLVAVLARHPAAASVAPAAEPASAATRPVLLGPDCPAIEKDGSVARRTRDIVDHQGA